MPGKRPHCEMLDVFDAPELARQWLDPQDERVWEEPIPATAGIVAVSRGVQSGFCAGPLAGGLSCGPE
jgi:hypothetical protein